MKSRDEYERGQWSKENDTPRTSIQPLSKPNTSPKRIIIALIDPRPLRGDSFSELIVKNAHDIDVLCFADLKSLSAYTAEDDFHFSIIMLSVGATALTEEIVKSYIDQIKSELKQVALVILSDCEELRCMKTALSLGVRGYLPTTLTSSVAIAALRLISAGGVFIPSNSLCATSDNDITAETPEITAHQAGVKLEGFTPRQIEVMRHLKVGNSNKVIAAELGVQESTIKVHVREVMKKLNVTNRTQAAICASKLFSIYGGTLLIGL